MNILAKPVRPGLLAGAAFALMLTPILSIAQELGSPGDTVHVTWGGKPTTGKIEHCSATACDLYLYDDALGRWSEGTAFFPRNEIRGLRPQSAPSPTNVPGAISEHLADNLLTSRRFAQAAVMYQRAADAYRVEGNDAGYTKAIRESAAAHEAEAEGGQRLAPPAPENRTPERVAPPPAQGQWLIAPAVAANSIPSGHYGCLFGNGGSPGYVDIRGGTYRGPTLDGSGGFSAYSVGPSNSITWRGGFGQFNVVGSEYMGISDDTSRRPWFAVLYRTRSGVDRVDCERE